MNIANYDIQPIMLYLPDTEKWRQRAVDGEKHFNEAGIENVIKIPGIYGEGVGGGVRKEDTALKEKLNAAISALAKAGKFEEITKNYPQLVGKMTLPKG